MALIRLVALEVRRHLASFGVRVIVLASIGLAIIAVRFGTHDYEFRKRQYDGLIQQRALDRTAGGGRVMGWSAERGLRAVREPSVLSIFVRGLDASMPVYWDFSPAGIVEGPIIPSATHISEAGALVDSEWIVRLVLGLLAVVLALDVIAGDRASGIVRSLLSQPIGIGTVVAGKIATGSIVLMLAVLAVNSAAVLTVWLTIASVVSADLVWFEVISGLTSLAYLVTLFCATAAFAIVARDYRTSGAIALGLWLYAAVIGPEAAIFGAKSVAASGPRQLVELEEKRVADTRLRLTGHALGDVYARLLGPKAFAALEHDQSRMIRPQLEPLWRAEAADTRRMLDAIEDRSSQGSIRESQIFAWLKQLNPGTVLLALATDEAGTGRVHALQWQSEVREYQSGLNTSLFDDLPRPTLYVTVGNNSTIASYDRRDAVRIADLPEFMPSSLPLSARLTRSSQDIATLIAYLIASIAAAVAGFFRATF